VGYLPCSRVDLNILKDGFVLFNYGYIKKILISLKKRNIVFYFLTKKGRELLQSTDIEMCE
jgi:hypothetical protein